MTNKLEIKNLGYCNYTKTFEKMRSFTLNRNENTIDEFWLLEHPPVFTQGLAGKKEHILNAGNIPVVQTDRGGQVTYHGPGQLVLYVLVNLRRLKIGVKKLVTILEESIIQMLLDYDINAVMREGAPGVYVRNSKICSIGLRIRNGCSYHGIALNIDMNLEPFSRINPCGFQNLTITQMRDFIEHPNRIEIENKLCECLAKNLGYETLIL